MKLLPMLTPVTVRHQGRGYVVGRQYPLKYDVLFEDGRRGCSFPWYDVEKRGEAVALEVVSASRSVRVLDYPAPGNEVLHAVQAHNRYLRVVK